MKSIDLGDGRFALVDDEDFEWLSKLKWSAQENRKPSGSSVWYARSGVAYMHREIMLRRGFSPKTRFDHADTNGLNNQSSNLRPASQSQNNANRRKESGCSSRFKGVSYWPHNRRWVAQLRKDGKRVYFGMFLEEEVAARAYDKAAREHYGYFALTNFL